MKFTVTTTDREGNFYTEVRDGEKYSNHTVGPGVCKFEVSGGIDIVKVINESNDSIRI